MSVDVVVPPQVGLVCCRFDGEVPSGVTLPLKQFEGWPLLRVNSPKSELLGFLK